MFMTITTISLRTALTLSLLAAAATAVAAEPADSVATDSVAARNLSEVTVTAKNVYKVTDGYAFVPSKTVKKTSADVNEMIRRTPLSNVLIAFDGKITDLNQTPAKYFIDGQPATSEEVVALLNKDVARIEFLNYPADTSFQGAKFAINIVTRKVISGGYVIANGRQQFISPYSNYSLLGKYVGSPKWSLMAVGNYSYLKDTGTHGTETTRYDLKDHITGEMVHIDRTAQITGRSLRFRSWSAGLNWRYKFSERNQLTIQAGISTSRTPNDCTTGILEHDSDSDGTAYSNSSSDRSQSPYITASWNKSFANGMALYVSGGFYATFSKTWSDYISGDSPVISNYFREKGYSPNFYANWQVPLKHNNSLTLDASYKTERFNVEYAGSVNTTENRHEDYYSVSGSYNQRFKFNNNMFGYYLSASIPLRSITMSDGRKFNAVDYSFVGSTYYYLGDSHSFGLGAVYELRSRPISTMNDLKIQDTDISGHEGNPDLKANQQLRANAFYTWMASRKFNLSASVMYINESKNIVTAYNAYNGVVYTSMINSGKREFLTMSLNGSIQLFNNNLLIKPGISLDNNRQSGMLNFSFWTLKGSLRVDYMHPCGFSAGLSYSSPWGKSSLQDTSTIHDFSAHNFEIQASYTIGNLYVQLKCQPLYKYRHNVYYVDLPGVDIRNDLYDKSFARSITLTAKYTLDFGRKYQHEEMSVAARTITSM